jgi:hypothetical protein
MSKVMRRSATWAAIRSFSDSAIAILAFLCGQQDAKGL